MSKNFDYQAATLKELADYVQCSTSNKISQQLSYYKQQENVEMIEKIQEARRIVRKRKLVKMLEAM
jgi:hypothetical protein